jgi:murein DD-endopeptidase MepM/ murein hydrolase activator NlpD
MPGVGGAVEGSGYHELNVGESIDQKTPDGGKGVVALEAFDDRSVTVRVVGDRVEIPLGHFANRTLGNPPGDVLNVAVLKGLRVGADVTRPFMSGSRYSLSLVNLAKDARLFVGPAEQSLSGSGQYAFPVPDFEWNYGENWLQQVPYGWHLGVDMDAERGHPLVAVTEGTVQAIRHYDASGQEDYWGNGLALLGDDRRVYIYMHWDELAGGVEEGSRVRAGELIGSMGRSGFETKPFGTHLHFEVMILRHPEQFTFGFELEPEVLPTPNRVLQPNLEGFVVNPYPYLVEWYIDNRR